MKVNCSKCGQSFEAASYQSINTAADPHLKERVRDGSLFVAECPYCGTRNLLKYNTLYHDPSARLMVWLLPDGYEPPAGVAEAVRELEGYTLRRVKEVGDLIEKVCIADAGLEDTVMEVCKWVTRQELAAKNPEAAHTRMRFLRLEGADHDLVMAFPLNGAMNMVNVGFNVYEDAKAILSRNPSIKPAEGFAEVDSAWADGLFR